MKIQFTGHFRDVQRSMRVPEQEQGGDDFTALLGDLTKTATQQVENIEENKSPPLTEEMRGRYNFDDPGLKFSGLEAQEFTHIDKPGDKTLTSEVKAPTILSARRITSNSPVVLQEPPAELRNIIENAGRRIGIDPTLINAVAQTESSFNPEAVSKDGFRSKGLFQLLDSTGKGLHQRLDMKGRYDPFNPEMNAELGVNYIRYLHEIFNRPTDLPNNLTTTPAADSASLEKLAVAAFNAGEGRVASAQARAEKQGRNAASYEDVESYLPEMTQNYVKKVFTLRSLQDKSIETEEGN